MTSSPNITAPADPIEYGNILPFAELAAMGFTLENHPTAVAAAAATDPCFYFVRPGDEGMPPARISVKPSHFGYSSDSKRLLPLQFYVGQGAHADLAELSELESQGRSNGRSSTVMKAEYLEENLRQLMNEVREGIHSPHCWDPAITHGNAEIVDARHPNHFRESGEITTIWRRQIAPNISDRTTVIGSGSHLFEVREIIEANTGEHHNIARFRINACMCSGGSSIYHPKGQLEPRRTVGLYAAPEGYKTRRRDEASTNT